MVIFTNCGLLSNKLAGGTACAYLHFSRCVSGAADRLGGLHPAFAWMWPVNARSCVDITVKLRQSFALGVSASGDVVAYLWSECQCLERGFYSHLELSFTVRADEPLKMLHSVEGHVKGPRCKCRSRQWGLRNGAWVRFGELCQGRLCRWMLSGGLQASLAKRKV